MHVVDLQICPDTILSTINELCEATRAPKQQALDRLRLEYQHWCTETSVSAFRVSFGVRSIKSKLFQAFPMDSEPGESSGKVLKAAAARLFTYWLTPLLVDAAHANPSLHNKPLVFEHPLCCVVALRHRANTLLSLTTMYTILAEGGLLAFKSQYKRVLLGDISTMKL